MSAGFTPGPWLIEPNVCSESPPSIMVSTQDAIIAEVYADDSADEPECVATANLIAAAPELYDGCNALLGLLQLLSHRDDISDELRQFLTEGHRIDEAEAAVAKARGEQVSA